MLANMKRFTAFMLALVLVIGLFPTGIVRAEKIDDAQEVSAEAYAEADSVFDLIEDAESSPAKKNSTQTQKTEAAIEIVKASESYVEGSLEQNGNAFTWWTDDGIHCAYSPRMREINSNLTPEDGRDEIVNEPVAMKGGYPTGNQVYLIGPYYGYDSNFTNQYKNEAKRVAAALGDTDGYTLYSGTAATVDKVAEAISNGAVVFFDSHGTTDYENPYNEYDFVTGATSSYLCLSTQAGLTNEDYLDGALYYSDGDSAVNGAVIANHMKKNSPSGILWMAICLGMATDSLYAPLRAKGVEVVYGYSESVSFGGDYLYEETFWGEMIEGSTVAEAVSTMKNQWGNWDCNPKISDACYYEEVYSTIAAARAEFIAFPIVASEEDTWPGQRTGGSNYGADTLQTVKSTYTLFIDCDHVWSDATCSTPKTCTECGRTDGSPLPHPDLNSDNFCDVCGADTSAAVYVKVTTAPTDWSGQYLIVYEDGMVAFDGSLTTLDAVGNAVNVDIENDRITLDPDDDTFYFEISKISNGYSIRSASGYYIGGVSGSNKIATDPNSSYSNTISLAGSGVDIVNNSSHLRFNAAEDQLRFRYFKSTSYSNQQEIALYKLEAKAGSCKHVFTNTPSDKVAAKATCTEPAKYYVKCDKCGAVSDTVTVPSGSAAGHKDADGNNVCDVCGAGMGIPTPPVASGNTYKKVTTTPSDWSGQYLIVYKDGSLAFNGSLTDFDAVNNGVSVKINGDEITLSDANANIYFTIAKSGSSYTIQSASGYYIGATGNTNSLLSSKTTAYTNTLSVENASSVLIKGSGGAFLRFNAANDQMRFRYYKTTSYTGQKAITLYKLVEPCKHSYEGVVTTAPTCTTAGVKTFTCSKCGDNYTETIAALGHTKAEPVVENEKAPTCVEAGSYDSVIYCSVCKAELSRETLPGDPATGEHTYEDGKCTECGAEEPVVGPILDTNLSLALKALVLDSYIGAQFIVNPKVTGYDNIYITVSADGAEPIAYTETIDSRYYAYTHGVAPKNMNVEMEIIVYGEKDGKLYAGVPETWSVKGGIIEMLDKYYKDRNSDVKMMQRCVLLVDMLYYGAAAQTRFGATAHGLATDDLNPDYAALRTVVDAELTVDNTTVSNEGDQLALYSLGLEDQVDLQFIFKLAVKDQSLYTIKVTYGDKVKVYGPEDFAETSSSYAAVVFSELGANAMRDTVSVALFKGETQVSETYVASIAGTAKALIEKGGVNVALAKAMMIYGDSAAAFLTK